MGFNPLRPNGPLGSLLRDELGPKEIATVLSKPHKDGTEIDATLYRKGLDGKVYPVEKIHLDQNLNPINK